MGACVDVACRSSCGPRLVPFDMPDSYPEALFVMLDDCAGESLELVLSSDGMQAAEILTRV